jgi:D-lactate dehydrogenase
MEDAAHDANAMIAFVGLQTSASPVAQSPTPKMKKPTLDPKGTSMKVVVYELEDWERQAFEPLGEEHDVVLLSEPLTHDNAGQAADADIISTFIYSKLGRDVLEQFDTLKLIATRSTGYDHIDLDYCRDKSITVSNVPSYGKNTVAEHVFGLLLTISHHLYHAIDRTRKGDFSFRGLQGFDLAGKTLGVVGTGDIGQCVIGIAKGFAMDVVAYDVVHYDEAALELGFEYVELDRLLSESDVITMHVPGTPKTRDMIAQKQFQKMKDGVVLINTARGGVVNVEAMVEALASGKLAAAGLDVLSEEPVIREEAELLRSVYQRKHDLQSLLADHVLLRLRNVVVTPHSAFNTREAVRRILDTTRENICTFLEGEPANVVDIEK